jgi:hypothetical protein
MCGAPIGPPPPPAVPNQPGRERARIPVSGPSFLGLGDERSRDLDYLLEDEPPRGHGRLYLALLLLVVSAGLLAWHWQRDGYPWAGLVLKPTATTNAPVSSPPPVTPPDSAAATAPVEPTANPAPPETQPAAPPAAGDAGQPPSADPVIGGAAASPSIAAKSDDQASSPNDVPDSGEAAKPPVAASPQTSVPENAEPAPKQQPAVAPPSSPKPAASKPSPALASPGDSFEDRLVADGEKYLYGRGVPEDCARAQRNLQIGAKQSNSKAQTLLGAMYATGHCVNRDLPTAYRWFAKALHGDPSNSRVQRDLEVLWKQMTPEERLLAMKNQ